MSEPGMQEIPRSIETFNKSQDLSKLEHVALIGSSVGDYNWAQFENEAKQKKISLDSLKVIGKDFPMKQSQVQRLTAARENQHELVGIFPFLAENIDELPKGYKVYLQPVGLINPETGVVDPIWRVSIVDKEFNPINSKALGDLIHLAKTHAPYFHLEDDEPGAKLLLLNDELQ